jgi:glycosyltransferase involved in cell wall biosynthesis
MKKILWLASWYPNRADPLNGDFIERHARAAARFNDIQVIHVLKEEAGSVEAPSTERRHYAENLHAEIIYYRTRRFRMRWLETLFSNYRFLSLYLRSVRAYRKTQGDPHCIHVHIALKAGLVALWYKWRFRIPYLVSEQWTGLCPEAIPNIRERSFVFRKLWKIVMNQAAGYSAVSDYLSQQIRQQFSIPEGTVIPNVVDTGIFYPAPQKKLPFHFIHISTLKFQKNPEEMLEAAAILKTREIDFRFSIVGPATEELRKLAMQLGLEAEVDFKGVVLHPFLAEMMRAAHALVLYSRFETFGCVLIEANASGLPVVVSDIPVLHETVREGINGVFVPLGDPGRLADAMLSLIQDRIHFDKAEMVRTVVEKYSFEQVGGQFDELYNHLRTN